MSNVELAEKISLLPEQQKKQLESIIDEIFLSKNLSTLPVVRKPGFAKGIIKILPGFDDPIEGMEEYTK